MSKPDYRDVLIELYGRTYAEARRAQAELEALDERRRALHASANSLWTAEHKIEKATLAALRGDDVPEEVAKLLSDHECRVNDLVSMFRTGDVTWPEKENDEDPVTKRDINELLDEIQ